MGRAEHALRGLRRGEPAPQPAVPRRLDVVRAIDSTPSTLISYIAPAAPATRRPGTGAEPYLRPEIGFTPRWYREALGIDFGERWHTDPAYRRETVLAMRAELRRRFPDAAIGGPDEPIDILTGTYGTCLVAGIYGIPLRYFEDAWPACERTYLSDAQIDAIEPPDLDRNPRFGELMAQVDWIAAREGRAAGFINWQGVLNNALRLRGMRLLMDLIDDPERCRRLFDAVSTTMIDGARRLRARQGEREGADAPDFFTVSNCLVNTVAPGLYAELVLPFDRKIALAFDAFGIHNCAWAADPYLGHYATLPGVAYIDMGIATDLRRARSLFPRARRAVMYAPMDLARNDDELVRLELERVADELGPCDVVFADIEAGTPDDRIRHIVETCRRIGERRAR